MAREPGHRSKIAVVSHEPGVDPVGACVGAKGSRVRMVVNELRGEKIDIVQWTEELSRFVAHALAPAKVKEVRVDRDNGVAQVIVPDYQLSLAIGKEGQNARLAAKLTGLRIDIKSESQSGDEARSAQARPAPLDAPEAAGTETPETPDAPEGAGTETPDAPGTETADAPEAPEPPVPAETTEPAENGSGDAAEETAPA